jgi:hypothetical protein
MFLKLPENMNKRCKHKETGKEGIIKSELKGNDLFPDQFGIYWLFKYDSKTPSHYYWNDKDKIDILE